MNARTATKSAAIWNAAKAFAANHAHVDFTATEVVARFDSAACGRGHTLYIRLESDRPEHVATEFRQTVWDDGDATPVNVRTA